MFLPIILALTLLHDAESLRRTAPADLSLAGACANLAAARAAGAELAVDPDLLLAVAHHESRYQAGAVTAEPGRKVSCGVMTPEPLRTCRPSTLERGYLDGARHLRGWLDACRGRLRCALTGYAGGFRLVSACARGPVVSHRRLGDLDLCRTADVFLRRARLIRESRLARPRAGS